MSLCFSESDESRDASVGRIVLMSTILFVRPLAGASGYLERAKAHSTACVAWISEVKI